MQTPHMRNSERNKDPPNLIFMDMRIRSWVLRDLCTSYAILV